MCSYQASLSYHSIRYSYLIFCFSYFFTNGRMNDYSTSELGLCLFESSLVSFRMGTPDRFRIFMPWMPVSTGGFGS